MNPTSPTDRWLKWTAIGACFVCLISLFGFVSFLYSNRTESLHAAARHGDLILLQRALLLQADVNDQTDNGRTPLHDATLADQPEAAELLLDRGAAADIPDKEGMTPLLMAIRDSRYAVMKTLLLHGASTSGADKNGLLPLVLSISNADTTAALLMIKAGADLNITVNVTSADPRMDRPIKLDMIHFAAGTHIPPVMRELIDRGAEPDALNDSRADGVTPLVMALANNQLDSAKFLLENGANPNRILPGNRTPVFYAAAASTSQTLEWLLPKVADINIKTANDETPLFEAVTCGNIAAVKTLLKHGADPNIPAKSGTRTFTPLAQARQLDLKEIARDP